MKPRHEKPSRESMGLPPKPTIRNLFKKNATGHAQNQQHNHEHEHAEPESITIHTIAVVIDGEVYEVLRAQDKLADILLAQPTFVLVTEDTSVAKIKYQYKDGKFTDVEGSTTTP